MFQEPGGLLDGEDGRVGILGVGAREAGDDVILRPALGDGVVPELRQLDGVVDATPRPQRRVIQPRFQLLTGDLGDAPFAIGLHECAEAGFQVFDGALPALIGSGIGEEFLDDLGHGRGGAILQDVLDVVLDGLTNAGVIRFQLVDGIGGLGTDVGRQSEGSASLILDLRADLSGAGFGLGFGREGLPDALPAHLAGDLPTSLATGIAQLVNRRPQLGFGLGGCHSNRFLSLPHNAIFCQLSQTPKRGESAFCPVFTELRRSGRVVECGGLENL